MIKRKRMKIFTMNNPNCSFTEKPKLEFFYSTPIIHNDSPIGIIPNDYFDFEWVGEELFATCVFYGRITDSRNLNVDELNFKNYMVQVKDDVNGVFEITNILQVEVA